MSVTRVVVTGVTGRMGSLLVKLARSTPDFVVAGGTERAGAAAIGLDVGLAAHSGPLEVVTMSSLEQALTGADVVIDFTSPDASLENAKICAKKKVAMVVGSTGFSAEAKAQMAEVATSIALVMAPNMSVGVNLMIDLVAQVAKRLGPDFDIDVLETHHRHKKDAPSGTALRMAEEMAKATGRVSADIRTARVGAIGERARREIGVQTLRGGDVVGEHTVFFFGDGERLEITHRATNREQFARGALRAAKWVVGQPAGLYDMSDVLKG